MENDKSSRVSWAPHKRPGIGAGEMFVREEFTKKKSGGFQRRTYVNIKCAYCKKEKTMRSDALKNKNYCNASCSQKDRLRKPEDHPNWKGGRRLNHDGYVEVLMPEHHRSRGNGYVFEHIVVIENKLGRKLRKNEQVHHIDGDKTNNDPRNLMALKAGQHSSVTGDERRAANVIPCNHCGRPVYKKPFEQRKNKNSYCSRRCLGLWSKENKKGVFQNDK